MTDKSADGTERNCLMGHDWCDGPDGETVDGEAFGGLCGECWIRQTREKLGEPAEVSR